MSLFLSLLFAMYVGVNTFFYAIVPSTFLHSKRSEFRWDTLIILFHRKIKLAFKPFSGEMG